jgi:hypothetical protein
MKKKLENQTNKQKNSNWLKEEKKELKKTK